MARRAATWRFPSSPLIIRLPFFLLFGFNKGTLNQKEQKGTTQEPFGFKKGTPKKKGKRALLGNLDFLCFPGLELRLPAALAQAEGLPLRP